MKLFALMALGTLCFAQDAVVLPSQMEQVIKIIGGQWRCNGGLVEFHLNPGTQIIIGRAEPDRLNAAWQRMMLIFPEGNRVRAEFFDSKDHAIHYRLQDAGSNLLRFVDDPPPGMPVHRLTYEKQPGGSVTYRFETGEKTTDSGTMHPGALVRPLSE